MEIKIIELTDDRAKIAFVDESHTYMNALKEEMLNNPDVDIAQYYHEYIFTDPILLVKTKNKKDPISVIKKAAKNIAKDCGKLITQVSKA